DRHVIGVIREAHPAAARIAPQSRAQESRQPPAPDELAGDGADPAPLAARRIQRLPALGPPQARAGGETMGSHQRLRAPRRTRGNVPLVIGQTRVDLSGSGEEAEREPERGTHQLLPLPATEIFMPTGRIW